MWIKTPLQNDHTKNVEKEQPETLTQIKDPRTKTLKRKLQGKEHTSY